MTPLVVDSSVVVTAVLERGLSPKVARAIAKSPSLIVSRLALVETARALLRARVEKRAAGAALAQAERDVETLWNRCDVWEISRAVCADAMTIAPTAALRTLDAIHLATCLAARRKIPNIRLLTLDARMLEAAKVVGLRVAET